MVSSKTEDQGQFIMIDGESLTMEDVIKVAREGWKITLAPSVYSRVKKARTVVEQIISEKKVVYGINTGFGELSKTVISSNELDRLQLNLVRSHSAGFGDPLPEEIVRAMMLLRINCLARGHSGVRPETLNLLVEALNKNFIPFIPEKGSLGASGDLAPLAHMALALIGEGYVIRDGKKYPSGKALQEIGLNALTLQPKEGLALINGTQAMAALGILALKDVENLIYHAEIALSMTLEALNGIINAFSPKVFQVRRHLGSMESAKTIRLLLSGSKRIRTITSEQDAYTLRCSPQVHGAIRDAWRHVHSVLEIEINSVTDNPLIFPASSEQEEDETISAGNFHGEPVALALDYLALGIAELGNISERRIERLVNPHLSGLAPFLIKNSGLNSGFMIAHYTAAALTSQNRQLAIPASVDNIPVSANKEDHVSMGMNSALRLRTMIGNLRAVVGIELAAAAQALDLQEVDPTTLASATRRVYQVIRKEIPFIEEDVVMHDIIEKMSKLLERGSLLRVVHDHVIPIKIKRGKGKSFV